MRPIQLRHAALKVYRHVVNVPLKLAVQRGTESAAVCPSLPHRLHDHLGVRARLATVGGLVMLIKGVGAPEALVAAVAGVFARAVVELFLVPLPIKLALECLVARCAPELGLARGVRRGGDGTAHRRGREAAVAARAAGHCRHGRSVLRRRPERGIEVVIAKVLQGRGWFDTVNASAIVIIGDGESRTIGCHGCYGCHVLLLVLLLLMLLMWVLLLLLLLGFFLQQS